MSTSLTASEKTCVQVIDMYEMIGSHGDSAATDGLSERAARNVCRSPDGREED